MPPPSVLHIGVLVAVPFVATLSPAWSAGAQSAPISAADDDPEFRSLITQAVAELEAQRYHEALALFGQAHQRAPSARTLRGLGIVSFELGDYVTAMWYLEASLSDQRRPLTDVQREELRGVLARVRAFVGRVRVDISPARSELWIDGRPVDPAQRKGLLLSVGDHDLEARSPGYVPAVRKLRVLGGEPTVLRVALDPVLNASPRGPVAAANELPAREEPDSSSPGPGARRWYGSPWFWSGAALVVAAGAGVALAVARPFATEHETAVALSPNTPPDGVLSAARWRP